MWGGAVKGSAFCTKRKIFMKKSFEKLNSYEKTIILYNKYDTLLQKTAKAVLGDFHLAEEAVLAAFERVTEMPQRLDGRSERECRNFMVIVCRNIACDMLHERNKVEYTDADFETDETPEQILLTKETAAELAEAINLLPPRRRDIVMLKFRHQLKNEEIAKALNISVETVKKDFAKAKAEIKEYMKGRL